MAATISALDAAADEADLATGVKSARAAVAAELRAHTPAPALAAAWSEVLRHAVTAAARVTAGEAPSLYTWYVSGSVARGEAAPGSDVETLIVLADDLDDDAKSAVLAQAAATHALLERCDVRGDANGVLASRPRFCRRRASWTEGIERWCTDPRADRGVVMTGIVADSTALEGFDQELRASTVASARRHYPARQAMLQDATSIRTTFPSRLKIFATHVDTVDLKVAAVDPVVKIARWAALSAGSTALSTLDRLDDAAGAGILDVDDASSLRDCYQWLLRWRWRHRADAWLEGRRVTDVVALNAMAPQERAVLRSVAREVTGIGRKLNYVASTSSYQ